MDCIFRGCQPPANGVRTDTPPQWVESVVVPTELQLMELTYAPEDELFRAEIRAWLQENLPKGWFDKGFEMSNDARNKFNEEWPSKLFSGGWICATWPTEYGGKGLSTMQGVVLAEEFANAKAPMRADFFGDTLVGPTLLQWGTEEQKKEFLPQILNGKMRWCQGFSEPNSGSDLASLKTTAILDGDEWVINGQKVWTTQGHHADYCFLLTRTDPDAPKHKGISYLLVPMKQPGVEVRGIVQPDGTAEFCEVFFDNARCPKDNVVGGVNNGWIVTNSTLAFERGMSATTGYRRFESEYKAMVRGAKENGKINDPEIRQRLMEYYTKIQILKINGLRSLSTTLMGKRTRAWRHLVQPTKCSGPKCTKQQWNLLSTFVAQTRCLLILQWVTATGQAQHVKSVARVTQSAA